MQKHIYIFIIIFIQLLCVSCTNKDKVNDCIICNDFILNEPCMIVNTECDNTFEGEYLNIISIENDSTIYISPLKDSLFLSIKNWDNWALGWGNDIPLYDAGSENLFSIKKFNPSNGLINLGKLLRGKGFPLKRTRVVLWNRTPSGFEKYKQGAIVKPSDGYLNFAGNSLMYSKIIFDSINKYWVMFINEVDTNKIDMYAAISYDLIKWKPALDGKPVFTYKDFLHTSWAGWDCTGKMPQSALITDVIKHNDLWYFIMNGFNKIGNRQIGIVTSPTLLTGPYDISTEPSIKAGKNGEWDEKGVFYGKVIKNGNYFIMFYDGIAKNATERLGMAQSNNLKNWIKFENNPVIDAHTGWRSRQYCSEPAWVGKYGDYICVLIAGSKDFKAGPWHNYITKRMYKDVSGNVDDMQLGIYFSNDSGRSFAPHCFNPLLVNDYADNDENEHLGGSITFIQKNDTLFMFYLGKTTVGGLKYQPLLRYRLI